MRSSKSSEKDARAFNFNKTVSSYTLTLLGKFEYLLRKCLETVDYRTYVNISQQILCKRSCLPSKRTTQDP